MCQSVAVKQRKRGKMRIRDRYERVLKDLDVLAQTCRAGLVGIDNLEDKVRMSRTQNTITHMRHDLRTLVFDLDDAEEFAKKTERCPECYSLHQKD